MAGCATAKTEHRVLVPRERNTMTIVFSFFLGPAQPSIQAEHRGMSCRRLNLLAKFLINPERTEREQDTGRTVCFPGHKSGKSRPLRQTTLQDATRTSSELIRGRGRRRRRRTCPPPHGDVLHDTDMCGMQDSAQEHAATTNNIFLAIQANVLPHNE